MREWRQRERETNLILIVACYNELLLLVVHYNKLEIFFSFSTIDVGCLEC